MAADSGASGERTVRRRAGQGRITRTGILALALIVGVIAAGGAWYVVSRGSGPELVRIDGSSTVFPITSAWAGEFNTPQRQVVVAFSGTGGGFQKFCRGETDLSDASRPIKTSEADLCAQNGVTGLVEFKIAYDGISVVVPIGNTWVYQLKVKDLCRIWTSNTSAGACGGAGPHVAQWSELNASWPAQDIRLFGPGTDSGTFDYFKEVILTKFQTPITDNFFPSEDDNLLVQGIAAEPYSLGYFGFAYLEANLDKIRPISIDDENAANGDGPIAPSEATIKDGSYAPLSRPLFIYANDRSLARIMVRDFLQFGYADRGTQLVEATKYVSLTPSERALEVAKIPI